MREIFAHEMVFLDGFFAGPNGELDWFFWDDGLKGYFSATLVDVDYVAVWEGDA